MLFSFFQNWTHNSFDIFACRCDPFCKLDKFALLQFRLSFTFNVISVLQLIFLNNYILKWKYDGIIYYSQCCTNIVQISKSSWKQQKQLWILFYTFRKIPTGTSAGKFSVKLLPGNMGFVNCSGLQFSPDFQNRQKQSL